MTFSRRTFVLGHLAAATAGSALSLPAFANDAVTTSNGVTRFKEWKLFTGVPQFENFSTFHLTQRVKKMAPSRITHAFPVGKSVTLPVRFTDAQGAERPLKAFLGESDTVALLVLKNGKLVHEEYAVTGGRDVPLMSMSVAKSFISTLVGIALHEKHINSLEDPISDYSPVFKGSAYEGVRIKDVLQMSSGARWSEDYSNPESDALQLGNALSPGGSLDVFIGRTGKELAPGTVCRYNSADTQALGVLIAAATGGDIATYMQRKLVEPLGLEHPSYWIVDERGREMAFAGLLMTARDFAKLGELYRLGGHWHGRQILPQAYVEAATHADADHLRPGRVKSTRLTGYGYQWWLPEGNEGEFQVIGAYNQNIYVNRQRGVVIVKLSANRQFATKADVYSDGNLPAMRQIARAIG
ncbi:serine hydrolase domain-containing protein [Ottowia sp.]|uniref:serine hydrolase domain-containing protein n=1 Tax=Ottowia sp. TaxID=1898956 RepID=UPI002B6E39BF|nr:serine hydrolase [Ottowia sp.]